VPMSHLRGIPTALRERFDVPIVYYDADVPMSLPEYGGMDTGLNIYHGADPGEYDLVLSNSEGGVPRLEELGAKRAEALFWGADPALFAPLPVEKEHDVFFYAYGDKFRRNWIGELIGEPSRRLTDADFVLGGTDFRGDVGRARELGYFPVNLLSRAISASRINLNVARKPHAEVYASSTSRLFELAAAGAAIVTNPYKGIERWFEPGRELLVVSGADEAVEAYRTLLDDPEAASELGRRARERVLGEHTFADRARRLLAVGCGPGDEVIVPSLNFVAAANAIIHTGAEPVFCDVIGPDELNLDPQDVAAAITGRTKVVLALHYAGFPCAMDAIAEIADRHGLAVVEDAAHAPGASFRGRMCGTLGQVGCFSFFSNKNLPVGEGGMIVTGDEELAKQLRLLRSHGMTTLTWDRHRGHASGYDVV